jgi:hypothetical protein
MTTDRILKQLFAAFPNTQVEAGTVAVYMRMLRAIPVGELQAIVDQAIATCRFLPTVSELLDVHHGLDNIARLTWVEAWAEVQSEMRRIGSYGAPQFNDQITAQVVRSMGWRDLCASEMPGVDRAQFRDMYTALMARQDSDSRLLPQARELAARRSGLLIPLSELLTRQGKQS